MEHPERLRLSVGFGLLGRQRYVYVPIDLGVGLATGLMYAAVDLGVGLNQSCTVAFGSYRDTQTRKTTLQSKLKAEQPLSWSGTATTAVKQLCMISH